MTGNLAQPLTSMPDFLRSDLYDDAARICHSSEQRILGIVNEKIICNAHFSSQRTVKHEMGTEKILI